jgi:hypothetical protein
MKRAKHNDHVPPLSAPATKTRNDSTENQALQTSHFTYDLSAPKHLKRPHTAPYSKSNWSSGPSSKTTLATPRPSPVRPRRPRKATEVEMCHDPFYRPRRATSLEMRHEPCLRAVENQIFCDGPAFEWLGLCALLSGKSWRDLVDESVAPLEILGDGEKSKEACEEKRVLEDADKQTDRYQWPEETDTDYPALVFVKEHMDLCASPVEMDTDEEPRSRTDLDPKPGPTLVPQSAQSSPLFSTVFQHVWPTHVLRRSDKEPLDPSDPPPSPPPASVPVNSPIGAWKPYKNQDPCRDSGIPSHADWDTARYLVALEMERSVRVVPKTDAILKPSREASKAAKKDRAATYPPVSKASRKRPETPPKQRIIPLLHKDSFRGRRDGSIRSPRKKGKELMLVRLHGSGAVEEEGEDVTGEDAALKSMDKLDKVEDALLIAMGSKAAGESAVSVVDFGKAVHGE